MNLQSVPLINERLLKPLLIDPDRTPESIEARKIENRLLIEFNAIVIQIQKKVDFTISDYRIQFERVKDSLKQTVYDIIRSYYQQAYLLGVDYVNKALGTTPYLTESDIAHIKTQTENFSNRFWGRLEKMLATSSSDAIQAILNTGSFSAPLNEEDQITFFARRIAETKSYLYSSLAILIVTDALNTATVNKAKTIHDTLAKQVPSNLLTGAVTLAQTDFQMMDAELVRLMMLLNTLRYRWYTSMDDRVCKKCRSLEGKTWSIGLSIGIGDIPTIPDDTHFNCRCRLFLEADL